MSVNEKMTALADAIRSKTELTDKLSIDGMTAAVNSFIAGGADATAAAADIIEGQTAYVGGEKLTGTLPDLGAVTVTGATVGSRSDSSLNITLQAPVGQRAAVNDDTVLTLCAPAENFGTAAQSDVLSGKSFTSAAGLRLNGTLLPVVTVSGTATSGIIETGLTDIHLLALCSGDPGGAGLLYVIYDGLSCQCACVTEDGSCVIAEPAATAKGGTFTWNGTALTSGVTYYWYACGRA